MKVLLQRVSQASVSVEDGRKVEIGNGMLVLVGIFPQDGAAEMEWMATKTLGLRIFPDSTDPNKNMNRSVLDVGGEILAVSQFTLAADTSRGMRPGFSTAATPEHARAIYEGYVQKLREHVNVNVETGWFGEYMQVSLTNEGPATFMLER